MLKLFVFIGAILIVLFDACPMDPDNAIQQFFSDCSNDREKYRKVYDFVMPTTRIRERCGC
ncbi:MAG: hypothetical protein ACTSXG_01505 [Alphaproteobacteria bacterium]